jgi:ABC-type transporter Mla subunit MlaD
MPEGSTIPVERTDSGVELLQVVQLFDQRARRTLRRAAFDVGTGLAGRGEQLNAAIADLPEISRDGTAQLEALTREPGSIALTIEGTRRVARGLRGVQGDDVAASLESGSALTGVLAARAAELGRSIELLRPLEEELLATAPLADPVLTDAAALVVDFAPEIEGLADALPDLNRTLALGDELRIETDRLTGMIRPLLEGAAPVIASLAPTVATIDPLLKPLRELVDTLEPYDEDVTLGAQGLIEATTRRYPEGQTAPNSSALRFAPILTCHNARKPYPKPGTTRDHSEDC